MRLIQGSKSVGELSPTAHVGKKQCGSSAAQTADLLLRGLVRSSLGTFFGGAEDSANHPAAATATAQAHVYYISERSSAGWGAGPTIHNTMQHPP